MSPSQSWSGELPREGWAHDSTQASPIERSVLGIYGHAWRAVRGDFWRLLAVWVVGAAIVVLFDFALDGILTSIMGSDLPDPLGYLVSIVSQALVASPISAGIQLAYLEAARSGRCRIDDIFVAYRRNLVHFVVAQVITTVLVAVAFVILVVPGVVAAIRLSFVNFLVLDEGYGPIEAIGESWRRTSGFGWTLFGIFLLSIPLSIVGFLALVVGLVPAAMVIYMTVPAAFVVATHVHGRRTDGHPR